MKIASDFFLEQYIQDYSLLYAADCAISHRSHATTIMMVREALSLFRVAGQNNYTGLAAEFLEHHHCIDSESSKRRKRTESTVSKVGGGVVALDDAVEHANAGAKKH